MRHQYHHSTDIVPTILDAVGLEMPTTYRGVDQFPLNGVSMRYSFDQGAEADRLEKAVEKVLADGVRTADLLQAEGAKPASTSEAGDAVLAALDASL